jgi:hypothetical protein
MQASKFNKSRDTLNQTHNQGLGKASTVQNSQSGTINFNQGATLQSA